MRTMQTEWHERRILALAATATVWTLICVSTTLHPLLSTRTATAALAPGHTQNAVLGTQPDYDEVLWLARCIYSETKRPHEQELVAWVIRNRVETRYRGKSDYRSAVLDPYQFSAFNPESPKRAYFISLGLDSKARGFQDALRIAWTVMNADPSERPFSKKTRHFYSARSMQDGAIPTWAVDVTPVALDRHVDPRRFCFFDQVV